MPTYNIGFRMNRTRFSTRCKPVNPRAEKHASYIIVSLIPLMHISCRINFDNNLNLIQYL